MNSPFGQKVFTFYTELTKQVSDVHEEAKRIAALEKEKEKAAEGTAPAASEAATTAPTATPTVA